MILFNKFKRKDPQPPIEISPKGQEIIALILKFEALPSGFQRKNAGKQLNSMCLRNPQNVAALIFDDSNSLNEAQKERLLFQYSTDHWGSTKIKDNVRWNTMIRTFIIPLIDDLPASFQEQIKWYQKKGL